MIAVVVKCVARIIAMQQACFSVILAENTKRESL